MPDWKDRGDDEDVILLVIGFWVLGLSFWVLDFDRTLMTQIEIDLHRLA